MGQYLLLSLAYSVTAGLCPQLAGEYDECDDNYGISVFDGKELTIIQAKDGMFTRFHIDVEDGVPMVFVADGISRTGVTNDGMSYSQKAYCDNGALYHEATTMYGVTKREFKFKRNSLLIE